MNRTDLKPTVLFFSYQNLKELPGISKKILAQKSAIKNQGFKVFLSHLQNDDGLSKFMIEDKPLIKRDRSLIGRLKWKFDKKPIIEWIKENHISYIYVRYTKFADFTFVKLFKDIKKLGIKIIMEIPTYPYDKEFNSTSIKDHIYNNLEKIYRTKLAKYVDRIITFSEDDIIFGRPTIKIINGVSPCDIPIKKVNPNKEYLSLLGVASLNFWHGYDRIIEGLKDYYSSNKNQIPVYFHIVGGDENNPEFKRLSSLTKQYKLEKYIVFHGEKIGKDLDEIFDKCHIGIGSLGRHRNNIQKFQSLKNIEYGVRGIPFIFSEESPLFHNEKYIYRCKPDDNPIDINSLVDFYNGLCLNPEEIRKDCLKKGIDWDSQFKKIFSVEI